MDKVTNPLLQSRFPLIKLASNCQLPGTRPVLAIQDAVNLPGLCAIRQLGDDGMHLVHLLWRE